MPSFLGMYSPGHSITIPASPGRMPLVSPVTAAGVTPLRLSATLNTGNSDPFLLRSGSLSQRWSLSKQEGVSGDREHWDNAHGQDFLLPSSYGPSDHEDVTDCSSGDGPSLHVRAEDGKNPSGELANFQYNLIRDQMGTLARELAKLRQELGMVRSESDRQSGAWEKGDCDITKLIAELKQAYTSKSDDVERELRSLRCLQGQESEEQTRTLEQLRVDLEKESRARREVEESNIAQIREAVASFSSNLSSEAELRASADSVSKRELMSLRQVLEKEARDRSASNEDLSMSVRNVVDMIKQEKDDRCSQLSSLKTQMGGLNKDLLSARDDNGRLLQSFAALESNLRKEIAQLYTDYQSGHSSLRDLVSKLSNEQQSSHSTLWDLIMEHKFGFDAHQGSVHERFAEDRRVREQQMCALQHALEVVDGKLREVSHAAHETDGNHIALREKVHELKDGLDHVQGNDEEQLY